MRLSQNEWRFGDASRHAHAYLLESTDRSAGRAMARQLAKRILCEWGGAEEARWENGSLQDLVLIEEEKIPIECIRQLRTQMFRKPVDGRYKVFILDYADRMREEAQNALLKSLEEPPLYLVWILVADNAAKLLPTIRSRCQTLRLASDRTWEEDRRDGLLRMVEAALAGDALTVWTNRAFFEEQKATWTETVFRMQQYLHQILQQKVQGKISGDSPAIRQSVEKMAPRVTWTQVQEGLAELERIQQLKAVNVNALLALEHAFFALFPG